jgi:fumarate hydratase, class II
MIVQQTQQQPKLQELPIGINAAGKRKETGSIGEIEVPANQYWGAQTEIKTYEY